MDEPEREAERAFWSRIDDGLGLSGRDPFRGHDRCELCGRRGPRVPVWKHLDPALLDRLIPAERRDVSRMCCADICACFLLHEYSTGRTLRATEDTMPARVQAQSSLFDEPAGTTPAWMTALAELRLVGPGATLDTPLLSPAKIRALGWTRTDASGGKVGARWEHSGGWVLEHCGHPTALWPWLLWAPNGCGVKTGALADPPNLNLGLCWHTLSNAMVFVLQVQSGRLAVPGIA